MHVPPFWHVELLHLPAVTTNTVDNKAKRISHVQDTAVHVIYAVHCKYGSLCLSCVYHVYRNHFDSNILKYVELNSLDYQRVSNGNFNYRDKNEGLLKVKVSYVRYGSDKCADVLETVKDCKAMVTIVR